jgi:hypothetical protein
MIEGCAGRWPNHRVTPFPRAFIGPRQAKGQV